MTPLRRRMFEDMQLHGVARGTQDVYVHAVATLAAHYHQPPDQLTEEQVRQFFLHLINQKRCQMSVMLIAGLTIKPEEIAHSKGVGP